MFTKLNFDIEPNFSLRNQLQKTYIFDRVRKKYILLTPEEWVRQHVIAFLNQKHYISLGLISVERGLKLNNLIKRFDLKVFDNKANLVLLIECKAPNIALTEETFLQSLTYAQAQMPKYIMLTNGMHHIYYDFYKKVFLEFFPNL